MEPPLTHDPVNSVTALIRKIELPWLILAALLVSTLLAAFQSSRQLRADADARFAEIAQGEKRILLRQLREVENLLYGAKAFATALPNLSQATWDTYVGARMRDGGTHPGIVAIQFVPHANSPRVSMTTSGFTAPVSPGGNTPAWSTTPALADAISRATSTTTLVMSQPLATPAGVLPSPDCVALVLRLNADTASNNPDPATASSMPTVVAIIDLAAMVSSMASAPAYPVVHELFDGEKRLFPPLGVTSTERSAAEMNIELPVEFGQRMLRLTISSTPALEKTLRSNLPRAILVVGIFGTLLLGALVLLLTRLREQAETLAASMTRKLQDQTRFTEDLIEFNPNPIYRKDTAGRFVAVNQAWEQLLGRSREDVLGKTSSHRQSPGAFDQGEGQDMKLLTAPSGYEAAEVFITNADGRQFETIIAKKILKRADGTVDGMIGTITDVTLIKKLERELARQREQLDLVIRSSQQGIWDITLVGDNAPYYSDRFREILGYVDGIVPANLKWQEHVHPDDAVEFRRRVVEHFKGLTALFDIESRVKCRNQSYVWVRARAIAQRDADGRAIRFVGSITDITDRKMAEVALTDANVRVTEAARAKEAFLATMSHEIRTPLNGVLGIASLLSETSLNDEQHDYIRLIRASGDTLLRLIGDVLDFSKIESGRMMLESVTVEIVTLVEEAFELVAEKAREKGLALLFDMHDNVPFYILGDATRIRQILLNLLSNAIKFTEKGEITLQLRTRRMSDGQLELEGRVADTGIGIPAERASKLFQPFTQVDASTTRKYGGTGLGLAIVRRLSQMMGGDVGVESTEGKGSTFIFTLLTSAARGPLRSYMQRDVFDFLHKRLLVVDRNANRRNIQQHRYARWGFDTVTATPEEAVSIFTLGPPFDILLTEVDILPAETLAMQKALEANDHERQRLGQVPISVILQSTSSRSALSQKQISLTLRHDAFIVRPAGRGKIFDLLMRAILHEPNTDIATRPYVPAPVYNKQYQAAASERSAAAKSISTPTTPSEKKHPGMFSALFGGRPPKILVAEDNEVNQQVILGMLKNLGCESDLACDGSSAVKKAIAGRYDVILMDMQMPELDGVTAMQNIRALLAGKICPPIVAMTAHALPGDRERFLSIGMNDYVAKPVSSADLKSLFERIFTTDVNGQPAHAGPKMSSPPSSNRAGAVLPVEELPVLDTEQLEDLRYLPTAAGSGDDEQGAVGGLIRLFQAKANERMGEMGHLLAGGHWSQLAEVAHSLRGSSASMGFPRVAARCKDLEFAARRMQSGAELQVPVEEDLQAVIARIKFHYAEADTGLREWLTTSAVPRKQ